VTPAAPSPETTVLETERLFLRELQPSDLADLAGVLGDAETMRFYPHPKSREETMAWIEWSRRSYADNGFGLWGVVLKEDGNLVGDCGLTSQDVQGETFVEVGYHLDKRFWHRGFATEAALACRDHAFEVVGVDRLIALIRPENEPSWRLAQRLGLQLWRRTERDGIPHVVYSMTRTAWKEVRGSGSGARD
jgi:RimJ/RimL family protein N-acetyltransferase